jgi:hypothetical protein
MDVLRFIKDDLEKIRGLFGRFESAPTPEEAQRLADELLKEARAYQIMEQTYILPEFSTALSERDQTVVKHCLESGQTLKSQQEDLVKALGRAKSFDALKKRVLDLKSSTLKHFDTVEQDLMPKVRQAIPTAEREDMGLAFQDLRSDLSAQKGGVH